MQSGRPLTDHHTSKSFIARRDQNTTPPNRNFLDATNNEMPSKTPNHNGNDPVENGVNSTKDVEMNDDSSAAKKGGKGKNVSQGENMTVVVPPSKGSKSSDSPADAEGNVNMGEDAGSETEEVVDPAAQTIARKYGRVECWNGNRLTFVSRSYQERFCAVGEGRCSV